MMGSVEAQKARAALLGGAERAGARAHFRAMGIDPGRLGGPIIGVASTWTGTMPCNLNPIDVDAGTVELEVEPAELERRLAACEAPAPRYESGVFARYRAHVASASEGAVLRA